MDVTEAAAHLSAHPVAGTSLAYHDVLHAAAYLQKKGAARADGDLLRTAAVLFSLYVDEVFDNKQACILGVGKRAFYSRLQTVVQAQATSIHGLTVEDLIIAVAEVDTSGSATRLLQLYEQQNRTHALPHLLELPSASTLEGLRPSPMRSDADEPPPHVSWLASWFANGLGCIGVPVTSLLHSPLKGSGFGLIFIAVALSHAVSLLLWRLGSRRSVFVLTFSRILHLMSGYIVFLMGVDAALTYAPHPAAPPSTTTHTARLLYMRSSPPARHRAHSTCESAHCESSVVAQGWWWCWRWWWCWWW